MIYLDNAATTPVRREALEAMWPYLTNDFGNPSSAHDMGASAARGLDAARRAVAAVAGCRASDIIFTSGGTEADNLAIKGIALASTRGRHLVTTRIEHDAVLESVDYLVRVHGFEASFVPTDATGLVDPAELAAAVRPDTALVTIQYANNEIGTVQPISELAAVAHAAGAPFHTDAVQAAGWLPLAGLGVDALSLSGHKVGAPKGSGVAIVRGRTPLEPLVHGGGQERGRRSGTENVAGAVALATALTLAEAEREDAAARVSTLRDVIIERVLAALPDARLTGHPSLRLPGTASFVFASTSGEAVLLELERVGIVCSSGSACAAGSDEPSHVLTALGLSRELAQTAVRLTLGTGASAEEIDRTAASLIAAVETVTGIGRN
ncbi:cysteine desulfurase family protein [Agromyces atrinae]|uniref:cysteine desulfurase n=1 Tax=Agromyces atrinae TaxID=592376 RepID=A0A4Q2M3I6_9MICO|nr:cysteine desulfurase family protein [Agromyces atrinae]NYD65514.1 cysteine desulfurase [Agromyces atrinae]RXZ85757.1 cysteine desulfurase [Agromyces atrinae]